MIFASDTRSNCLPYSTRSRCASTGSPRCPSGSQPLLGETPKTVLTHHLGRSQDGKWTHLLEKYARFDEGFNKASPLCHGFVQELETL
ncbi:hypothetical protein [Fischerella sp. PCC 9605]|uniref:hypothetical protein n=1 Tax=Fischerella sp. PCC 9605 TaxID=1173024 RepID=UPI0012DBF910|nr:hypothetical protein [Fischerella sp. PCC 9605]